MRNNPSFCGAIRIAPFISAFAVRRNRLWSLLTACLLFSATAFAKDYFVSLNGNDANDGSIQSPFATLNKAQSVVQPGDNVYFRGGTYKIQESQIMEYSSNGTWAFVFKMAVKGSKDKPIGYQAYENEKVVFDLSAVKPLNRRVLVFYVTGHYLHFKNFEVVGTQVTITGHTQSECFRVDGGNNNTFENISCHDGMAIGFYLVRGKDNLVLNCDAYNNYDPVSEGGRGGNVDGFGGHLTSTGSTGNVFRGCRAWYNSDDGFDLINCVTPVVIENCWAFRNGYEAGTNRALGDGTGFKAGGYGMEENPKVPAVIPRHVVRNSLACYNKNKGFYANHHLGGIDWYNNTGYLNPSNFCMLNRKSATGTPEDVPGYGHVLKNNLSYKPRTVGADLVDVNMGECTLTNNSFHPAMQLSDDDFLSLNEALLTSPRRADGSLPDIDFLKIKPGSLLSYARMGYAETYETSDAYAWMRGPAIVVEGTVVRVVGTGAEAFTKFYINGSEISFDKRAADLSALQGKLELKATSADGGVTKLIIKK